MAEKKKKTLKKKTKDFANRKTKEYLDSAVTAMTKVGKSNKADLKNAALVIPKMFRGFVTSQANRLVNSKEERKAGGLNYKVGGVVKDYSLSADDKRRRKAFKSGAGKGRNNTGMKKIKMKEGGMLKSVPEDKKKSLGKLPTPVREKMGFMKEGGSTNKEINKILTETTFETADRGFKKPKKKSAIQSIGAGALKGTKSYKKRQEDISKKMDAQYKSDIKKFKDDKKGLKEGGMVIVDRQYLKGK